MVTTNQVRRPAGGKASVIARAAATARRAFTLVELLVVVGIIAVLVGILLPTLGRAREQANIAQCMSNLRQIGVGFELYSQLSKGQMPLPYEKWITFGARAYLLNGNGRTWAGLLRDVAKVPVNAFRCPSELRDFRLDSPTGLNLLVPNYSAETNAADTYRSNPMFVFSYGVFVMAVNNEGGRRPAWAHDLKWGPPFVASGPKCTKGPVLKTWLKPSQDFALAIDSYFPYLNAAATWENTKAGWRTSATDANSVHRPNIWRHALRETAAKKFDRGPNCLFADGHVEPRIDLFGLKETQVSLPAP